MSFIKTDARGQFTLDGKPWFLHGVTYFGRRPGTCNGSWLGKNFQHNLQRLPDDLKRMNDAGLNTLGLFLPGADFYTQDTLAPDPAMFSQLDQILDTIADGGLRTVIFPCTRITKETWCRVKNIDPGKELWNSATNPDCEKSFDHTFSSFLSRYAKRDDVIGTMGRVGRFDFTGWDPPEALGSAVHSHWHTWLKRRFKGNFKLVRELLQLTPEEKSWDFIKLPTETPTHAARSSPRSFEYHLMQQVMISAANSRMYKLMKKLAPKQLSVNDMEGVEFAIGLLNVLVPELCTADAIWLECYNWEGVRGSHDTSEEHQKWLVEPSANKRTIDLINNAGYVQMLVKWMQQSNKALILCHGTDIGNRRGCDNEYAQALTIDRFNAYIQNCGAHGINYWCWVDDELSRSAVLLPEDLAKSEEARKLYWQAGETTGLLRFDGSERPAYAVVRATGRSLKNRAAATSPKEALVLCPTPIFQSLYRYRSNCSVFGILTSLARQGIRADVAFTSAGEKLIDSKRLSPYKLIVLGMASYYRDHPETAGTLLKYVKGGGTLFLPLALPNAIDDPYLKSRKSPALAELAGAKKFLGREETHAIKSITAKNPAFTTVNVKSWEIADEAFFTKVVPIPKAEVLIEADGHPLLYRHKIGKGSVYVFTWTLDVHLFKGNQYDYYGGDWDFLWHALAAELNLTQDVFNPMTRAIREMTYQSAERPVPLPR